jgi:3'-5' exoribonuclease
MEKIFVNELKKGHTVESIFLVREKSLTRTKAGNPYLSLRLADRTGEIEGRIWENALDFGGLFAKEDFIKVRGDVDEFQGTLQLRILKLRKCEESEVLLDDFLPKTPNNIEEMFSEIKKIAGLVRQPYLQKLLEAFFTDENFVKKFKLAPAAKGVHHSYLGGLLEHTLSIVQLILLIGPRYKGIDQDLLITSGILHDVGKVAELSFDRTFDYTDSGRLLGHIVLTVEMVDEKMRAIPEFPESLSLSLKHNLLSHHGEYAFGSPKLPMTLEALLLHQIDDLDAKVNGFLGWIEKEKGDPSRWTSYHKLFERFIFKPEPQDE